MIITNFLQGGLTIQIPIHYPVGDRVISAMLHVPRNRKCNAPVIVMAYGLNGCRSDVHRISVYFARQAELHGILVLRFDYRGQGVSEGNFWETTTQSKVEDILASICFLKGCLNPDKARFIVLGFSDGARIATRASVESPDVAALVMWSPVLLPTKAEQDLTPRMMREPLSKAFVFPFYGLWLGKEHLREMQQDFSIETFFQFKGPKLCVFGGDDHITETVRKEIGNRFQEDISVEVVPGSGHVFEKDDWTESVIRRTIAWVDSI